jgi:hypothetical protein
MSLVTPPNSNGCFKWLAGSDRNKRVKPARWIYVFPNVLLSHYVFSDFCPEGHNDKKNNKTVKTRTIYFFGQHTFNKVKY